MRDVARERAAQQLLLRKAERRIDAAALSSIAGWLDVFRYALLQELGVPERLVAAGGGQRPNVSHADYAIDNAVARSWGEWQNQLENQVLPTVSIAFGEAFQQTRRADPRGAFQHQQAYLAEVSDRLKIWPAGAFEDIRPELLEALSDAVTVDEMTERIGRVLNIDAKSRALRAQIGDVEQRIADPDTTPADRKQLRSFRRDLWERHDDALNEWQWKARRIARTESHGAVSAGQLAAAREREERTGIRMFKRWLSTPDAQTRATHRVADGQIVPLGQQFRVGGFLLDHPADSINVAPHEVIGCRCTLLIYDDDELQDTFDRQGGKGTIEPGSVRIGPDDPDDADAAIAAVAEAENRALPKLGQRGEDAGQSFSEQLTDVEITDERTPVPAPDLETASDQRLADYLIRTDELQQDALRDEVADELTRRHESDEIEVQFGRPEDADDVIEIDDDGAWLDDPRWSEPEPVDEPFEPDVPFDEWPDYDTLPGDAVPAEPVIAEDVGAGDAGLLTAAEAHDAALIEFAEAAESGDDDRITAALLAMDAAEARLTEATQLAEVAEIDADGELLDDDAITFRDSDDDGTYTEIEPGAAGQIRATDDPYVVIMPMAVARHYVRNNPFDDPDVAADPEQFAQQTKYIDDMAETLLREGWEAFKAPPALEVGSSGRRAVLSDGNHRILAAERAGLDEVPVSLILDEDDAWANEHGIDVEPVLADWISPDDAAQDVLDDAADDAAAADDLAAERARYAQMWGEEAAAIEFAEVETKTLTRAEQRRRDLMIQADEMSQSSDLTYEEALAELQGWDRQQMNRRIFVEQGRAQGYVSTSYEQLLSEVHGRFIESWQIDSEQTNKGHMLKPAYKGGSFSHDQLWQVNEATARKYMSDEMAAWFDQNGGRMTKAELERMIEAGLIVFDADAALAEYARWPGKMAVVDYLR